jgi:DNA-binding transcriptional LysR family regulator
MSRSRSKPAEIGTALRGYDLDFAIMGRPPADIDMDVHPIGDHPHVIIAPTSHRLVRKSRIALSDLADETFRTREPGSGHARPDGATVRNRESDRKSAWRWAATRRSSRP